ncbi:hypothetical protein Tco_0309453 [Tanacetum coccineum]
MYLWNLVSYSKFDSKRRFVLRKKVKAMPKSAWTAKDQIDKLLERKKVLSDIEDCHGPSEAMHNPPYPLKVSQKTLVSFLTEIYFHQLSPLSELVRVGKGGTQLSLIRSQNQSALLMSRAKRRSSINLIRDTEHPSDFIPNEDGNLLDRQHKRIKLVPEKVSDGATEIFEMINTLALRRSDNENMLSRSSRIRSINVKEFQRSFRYSDTEHLSRSDEVLKLKNFKKDATLKLFKSTNQEKYEHVGPKSQVQ